MEQCGHASNVNVIIVYSEFDLCIWSVAQVQKTILKTKSSMFWDFLWVVCLNQQCWTLFISNKVI